MRWLPLLSWHAWADWDDDGTFEGVDIEFKWLDILVQLSIGRLEKRP